MAAPMQQNTMQAHQHRQQNLPMTHPQREWGNSFWACCTPFDTFCLVYWCPCVLFGRTKARRSDPALTSYSACNSDCLAWCGLACFGVQSILQCVNRTGMREQLNINGGSFGDCCGACCCPLCGLMQEEKEMLLVNGQANGQAQGYQAQTGGMEYKN